MAIIIPSKDIYGQPKNDIVRKNKIDKIEVNANKVSIQIDKDNLSYTETVVVHSNIANGTDGQVTYTSSGKDFDTQSVIIVQTSGSMPNVEFQLLTYSEMKLGYLSIPIKVYANSYQDKYITDLYDGKDQDGNDRIEYTMDYSSIQLSASGGWKYNDTQTKRPSQYDTITFTYSTDNPVINYKQGKIIKDTLTSDTQNSVTLDSGNIKYHFGFSSSFKPQNAIGNVTLNVSNDLSLQDKTNVSTSRFTKGTDENGQYYAITLNILVSRIITTLKNHDYQTVYLTAGAIPGRRLMGGARYCDLTNQIQFTFHGETRFLNVAEIINIIGNSGSTNVFSIPNNELIQESNKYYGENAIQKDFNKLLQAYKDGKETATVLCSISDYKDESGNVIINTATSNKMIFDIGDEVIPMIYNAYGEDVPMSVYKDGTPKIFRVVGVVPTYDGVPMQELTLQEK